MHAPHEFNAVRSAKRLILEARTGALASLLPNGAPYASLVTVATLPDASPILLLSRLARHTSNILADARVSLLIDERRTGDPLEGARVSVTGKIARTDDPAARRRFLARHPSAETYAGFSDFSFWRIEVESAHLVAGFGRINDVQGGDLSISLDGAEALLAAEEGAIAHMNEGHADAIELYATRLLGDGEGPWRMIGVDPEGCDLILGDRVRRLDFPHRVTASDALRKILVDLVRQARGA
jgi:heme iron utilization protein